MSQAESVDSLLARAPEWSAHRGLLAHTRRLMLSLLLTTALLAPGCSMFSRPMIQDSLPVADYSLQATQIEYPNVEEQMDAAETTVSAPWKLSDLENPSGETPYWDMRLETAVRLALEESQVLRDLGGLVLKSPESVQTVQNPAIRETNPQTGTAAALSAFDPELSTNFSAEQNDRAFNNVFQGQGTTVFEQDTLFQQSRLSQRTPMGTELSLSNRTDYDTNNALGNTFISAWQTQFDAEIRQRLLKGAGYEFNSIAGPFGVPGVNAGIQIARINTDISLADFELRVRNYLSDVENAYWDLYYAYRDLDTKIRARNAALEIWRLVYAFREAGRLGGEAGNEAQAREQFFRLQAEVQNALTGRLVEGTRTSNGSEGGTFRANSGVLVAERRLRFLLGLPSRGDRLIRPVDEPLPVQPNFDWEQIKANALVNRVELRRQRWLIQRREAELKSSRNFLLPQFDAVGRYRWRGLGDNLFTAGTTHEPNLASAFSNLLEGQFQEWQVGFEMSFPLGHRQGMAAVRHAELQLARERTILREQEHAILYRLSDAMSEVDRTYHVSETSFNRLNAAREQFEVMKGLFRRDEVALNLVLDAQRRQAEAESDFYRSLVEHMLAIRNLHFEQGTLLARSQVFLSEGMWPEKAYTDASRHQAQTWGHSLLTPAGESMPVVDPLVIDQRQVPYDWQWSSPSSVAGLPLASPPRTFDARTADGQAVIPTGATIEIPPGLESSGRFGHSGFGHSVSAPSNVGQSVPSSPADQSTKPTIRRRLGGHSVD